MSEGLQGLVTLLGRVMLVSVFFVMAVGHNLNYFDRTVDELVDKIPAMPKALAPVLLGGASLLMIAGSLSVMVGYKARLGALLLLLFLGPTTYYFHQFWAHVPSEQMYDNQLQHFMKNLALMGAMFFIMGSGSGAWSLDGPTPVETTTTKQGQVPAGV
jgi:putative oxidoreductase